MVKKRRQRKGWGADGNRRKDGATEERKGAMARPCNDRPPDYFVAQINWPFAGSLESSCSAGEEAFISAGLEVDRGKRRDLGLLV